MASLLKIRFCFLGRYIPMKGIISPPKSTQDKTVYESLSHCSHYRNLKAFQAFTLLATGATRGVK